MNLLFDDYFSYPVSVSIRLEDTNGLLFPGVTICNQNPVRKSRFCDQETTALVIADDMRDFMCNDSYANSVGGSNTTSVYCKMARRTNAATG